MANTETGSQENGSTLPKPTYKRVMLKISGEALMGDQGFGLHPPTVQRIANEVKSVHDLGVEICMVIGGGNIFLFLSWLLFGMRRQFERLLVVGTLGKKFFHQMSCK